MNQRQSIACDGLTLTVRVPLTSRRRGGRKHVVTPEGATWATAKARMDSTMVKAIARGFRWRKLLETRAYGTIEEIATAESINPSYVSRVLRLTLLAPDIVEMVLDGRQPESLSLMYAMKPFPTGWPEQRKRFLSVEDRPEERE